jgi:hypothetical protein
VGICANDFKEKVSILSPIHEQYLLNPIVSGTTLLLQQALQYLFFMEKFETEIARWKRNLFEHPA